MPVAMCSVSDDEDGPSTFPATLSPITGSLALYGIGTQSATCSYTDAGGLTATTSVTYSIVDTTAPVIAVQSRNACRQLCRLEHQRCHRDLDVHRPWRPCVIDGLGDNHR
ncbi:MAG: hypothetical protein V9F04_17910 [Dermatophilaceae bacterium]